MFPYPITKANLSTVFLQYLGPIGFRKMKKGEVFFQPQNLIAHDEIDVMIELQKARGVDDYYINISTRNDELTPVDGKGWPYLLNFRINHIKGFEDYDRLNLTYDDDVNFVLMNPDELNEYLSTFFKKLQESIYIFEKLKTKEGTISLLKDGIITTHMRESALLHLSK